MNAPGRIRSLCVDNLGCGQFQMTATAHTVCERSDGHAFLGLSQLLVEIEEFLIYQRDNLALAGFLDRKLGIDALPGFLYHGLDLSLGSTGSFNPVLQVLNSDFLLLAPSPSAPGLGLLLHCACG